MCHKWKNDVHARDPQEPTLLQWKNFLGSLRKFIPGRFQINFAGGEPLARQETLALVSYACGLGFDTLLATNAFLIDREIAKRISASGLTRVIFSLDSLEEDCHDYIRGVKGVYQKVMRAIELLAKYAPRVELNICTVILDQNLEGLSDLVKWVQKNDKIRGVGFQAVTQPFSTPEDPYWHMGKEFSPLWPHDIGRTEQVMDDLIRMKQNGYDKIRNRITQFHVYKAYFRDPNNFVKQKKCHIDTCAINVTPNGEMRICFYMDTIGNIKTENIADIWFSQSAIAVRQRIAGCKKNCQSMVNCNFDETQMYKH